MNLGLGISRMNVRTGNLQVVIIAPHPDDAVLAAGGLIQRAQAESWQVIVLHMTHGEGFRASAWRMGQSAIALGHTRRAEAQGALQSLGVNPAHCLFLGFPDGALQRLTTMPITSAVSHSASDPYADSPSVGQPYTAAAWHQAVWRVLRDYQPQWIIAPDSQDANPDHQATGLLMDRLCAQWPHPLRLDHYRVHLPTYTPTVPRWTLTLTPLEQARKRQAIAWHISQMAVTGWWLRQWAQPREVFY